MAASLNPNALATVMPGAGTSFAIQEQEIGAAQIGSSAAKPSFLQVLDVTLTAAQVLAMYAAPIQLIAAPAAGTSIFVAECMIRVLPTATQFAAGGVVAPQYANTVHGGGTLATSTVAAATINGATQVDTQCAPVGQATGLAVPTATGLFISNATAAFTTGTGTVRVVIWYQII